MYRVEISFKTENISNDTIERISTETDKIFAERNLQCCKKGIGKRVYIEKGAKNDYGNFWSAFFALKGSPWFIDNVTKCMWYNETPKDLITGFLKA